MKLYRILILTLCAYALISCGGAEERKAVYMEKAKSSIETGDFDKARIELKNVLQIDPKDAEAYYQLGRVHEQQKDYIKAYRNYIKAEELNPELLANQARLGQFFLLLANEPEKAQEKIDFVLSKDPKHSEGLLLKAVMLLRESNLKGAIDITIGVIEDDPGHVEGSTFLATLYAKENRTSDAIRVLDDALKINQDNEQLNKTLGMILLKNKDYDRVEEIYKDFLKRNPNSISSYNNLAAIYIQSNNKIKAEEVLRASIDNEPDDVERYLLLIKHIKDDKGNDEAIEELNGFIAKNHNLGKLRIALAQLLILNGDNQSAIDVYKAAITDFPDNATGIESRVALAYVYIANKEFVKAREIVEEAYNLSPNDSNVNYVRARLALNDKDIEKAIISLRVVIKETPENINAYLLLVSAYQFESDYEQARNLLNKAYDNNKMNPDALLKLAEYHLSHDLEQAEKIIDKYNNIKALDYDGLAIKATILNQKNMLLEAYNVAEELIKLFPDKPAGYLQAVKYLAQKNDNHKVISVLEEGYESTKDNRALLGLLITIYVKEKQFDKAEKTLQAELYESPDDVALKIMLSKLYMASNDVNSATSLLNKIVDNKPDVEEPYLLLAQIYQYQKDLDSVKSILVQGKANVASSLKIPLKLAAAYEYDKDFQKAIDVYRDLFELNPENLITINNLASLLSDHSDDKNDLELIRVLAEKLKANEQSVFLDTIGWVYYKLGDNQDAIQYLTRAVESSPKVSIFNYHLGMSYKMGGDKEKARLYLEKSLTGNDDLKALANAALKDI